MVMISTIVFDLSRTLLFPKNKNYKGELNGLYKEVSGDTDFNFFNYFYLDAETLSFLEILKDKCDLYIFTTGSIQNDPKIKKRLLSIFKRIFSAEEMKLFKKDPKSYKEISKALNRSPQEIVYVDDSKENLEAARLADFNVVLFSNYSSLRKSLEFYLSST